MPFLDIITKSINNVIVQSFGLPVAHVKTYGISEVMVDGSKDDAGNDITTRFPSIIDADGEVTMIDVDDAFSMILYHKIDGITNSLDVRTATGRSRGNLVEAANMTLMLFAFRRKTRKEAWWFEAVIKDKLPDTLNIADGNNKPLQNSIIKIGNSSYDKLSLLQREYSSVQLNYPDLVVMELKYIIQSTWQKGCFANCGCTGQNAQLNYIATEQGRPILMEN